MYALTEIREFVHDLQNCDLFIRPLQDLRRFTFSHSFIPNISRIFSNILEYFLESITTQIRSRYSTSTLLEFHAEAPQVTASEGLAQGPYVAARA